MNYQLVLQQYTTIMILICIGYFLAKHKIFSKNTVAELAVFLLKGITPLIVFENMVLNPSNLDLRDFFKLTAISALIIVFGYLLTRLLKVENIQSRFAITFSNSGFVGIPLVSTFLSPSYVPYIIPFIMAQTLLVWTLGVVMMSNSRDNIDISLIIKNPAILSFVLSVIIVYLNLPIPSSVAQTTSMLTKLNTPLAMIILGTYVESIDKEMLKHLKEIISVSVMKLILVPLLSLLVLTFIPFTDVNILLTLLIVIACPSGTIAAMFSQLYNKDTVYAASLVSFTTLFSLFTIPLLLVLAENILKII